MDGLFDFLFGAIFDGLFGGRVRRTAKELRAQHDRANGAGEPLVCELPASLRTHRPGRRGRGQGKWTRGLLHIQATSLIWEPQPGKQGQSWDLTTASVTREIPIITSSNENMNSQKLIMQTGGEVVEVVIRRPFLPFLRVGLGQVAAASRTIITSGDLESASSVSVPADADQHRQTMQTNHQ